MSGRDSRSAHARDDLLLGVDSHRRWIAAWCDRWGLRPGESTYDLRPTGTPARLRRYGAGRPGGPPVLLVPAPIKTAAIWDLTPALSVVRRCLEDGCRVYAVDWPRSPEIIKGHGLEDYTAMLSGCIDAIRQEAKVDDVFITGHSVGGILAALLAARYPERVAGLTLLGAPLHFSPDIGALGRFASLFPAVGPAAGRDGAVSGSSVNLLSAVAAPETFLLERGMDWLASLPNPSALRLHLLVECWTLDETALPYRLLEEVVDRLYRRNAFMLGRLQLGGRRIAVADITAPVACVAARRCAIVPPESILPAYDAMGSEDRMLLWYHGDVGVSMQHIGMLVGPRAHRTLWPRLGDWLRAHTDPDPDAVSERGTPPPGR